MAELVIINILPLLKIQLDLCPIPSALYSLVFEPATAASIALKTDGMPRGY